MDIIKAIYLLVRAFLIARLSLAAEILALRQQVAVYQHTVKRPKLRPRDRIFWVWLSRLWSNWRSALASVQPETVIKWHRQGFKLYWRWKSRARKPGRPPIQREVRDLIRRMSRENPLWGAPRILSELFLLGYHAACDFFIVPTVTFRVLYAFIVLRHDRRRVVHFNVTDHPYAEWAAQQIIDAFPYEEAPRFLRRILKAYFEYYHEARAHLSLERNSPIPREVEPASRGKVISIPQVGGLHHRYARAA